MGNSILTPTWVEKKCRLLADTKSDNGAYSDILRQLRKENGFALVWLSDDAFTSVSKSFDFIHVEKDGESYIYFFEHTRLERRAEELKKRIAKHGDILDVRIYAELKNITEVLKQYNGLPRE